MSKSASCVSVNGLFCASAVCAPSPTSAAAPKGEGKQEAAAGEANPNQAAAANSTGSEEASAEAGASDAAGGGASSDAEAEASDEAAEAEAKPPLDPAQLNERVGKWAYQIPEYLFNRLSTTRSQFVGDQHGTS